MRSAAYTISRAKTSRVSASPQLASSGSHRRSVSAKFGEEMFLPVLLIGLFQTNYSVNQYFNELMRGGNNPTESKVPKAPRPPKQPRVEDFQFFPPRLFELLEREVYAYRKSLGWRVSRACLSRLHWHSLNSQVPKLDTQEDEERRQEQERIDSAENLTDAETVWIYPLMNSLIVSWYWKG